MSKKVFEILKKKPLWVVFSAVFLLFILLRNSFFGLIFEAALSQKFPKGQVSIEKIAFENRGFVFKNFVYDQPKFHVEIKEVYASLNLNWTSFQLTPEIKIEKPSFDFKILSEQAQNQNDTVNFSLDPVFDFFKSHLNLTVNDGVATLNDTSSIYFNFESKQDQKESFTLSISNDEKTLTEPPLQILIHTYHNELFTYFKFKDFEYVNFQQLIEKLFPKMMDNFTNVAGIFRGHTLFHVDKKGEFVRSDVQMEVEHLRLCTPIIESIVMDKLTLRTLYPQVKNNDDFISHLLSCICFVQFENCVLGVDAVTSMELDGKVALNMPLYNGVDIKGKVKIGSESSSLILVGEPKLLENQIKEFQLKASIFNQEKEQSQVNLTFENFKEQKWQVNAVLTEVDCDYLSVIQKMMSYYVPIVDKVLLKNGTIGCLAQFNFYEHQLSQIKIEKIIGRELELVFSENLSTFSCSRGEGGLDINVKDHKLSKWFVNLENVYADHKHKHFGNLTLTQADLKIAQELDCFSFSTIKGNFLDQPFKLDFFGHKHCPDISLDGVIYSDVIKRFLKNKNAVLKREEFAVKTHFARQDGYWLVKGGVVHEIAGLLDFGFNLVDFKKPASFDRESLDQLLLSIQKGWIKGKEIHEGFYEDILSALNFDWSLNGKMNIQGTIDQGILALALGFDKITFISEELYFLLDLKDTEKKALVGDLRIDLIHDQLELSVPIEQAICLQKMFNLWFEDISGHLSIKESRLVMNHLKAKAENLSIRGELELEFLKQHPLRLTVNTEEIKGKAVNLQRFARHFPDFQNLNLAFDGDLSSEHDGFHLDLILYPEPQEPKWQLQANIEQGDFIGIPIFQLENIKLNLMIDSEKPWMELKQIHSNLAFHGESLPCFVLFEELKVGLKDGIFFDFSMEIENPILSLASFQGKFIQNTAGWNLSLDTENCVLLDKQVKLQPFLVENGIWKSGLLNFQINQADVSQIIGVFDQFLKEKEAYKWIKYFPEIDFDTLRLNFEVDLTTQQLKCKLEDKELDHDQLFMDLILDKGQVSCREFKCGSLGGALYADLNSNGFVIKSANLKSPDFEINLAGGAIDLLNERASLVFDKLCIPKANEFLDLSQFVEEKMNYSILADGSIDYDISTLKCLFEHCKITNDSKQIELIAQKPFIIKSNLEGQFDLLDLELQVFLEQDTGALLTIQSKELRFSPATLDFSSKNIELAIAPELIQYLPTILSHDATLPLDLKNLKKVQWDNLIHISFDVIHKEEEWKVFGHIQDGYYWIKNKSYLFQDVGLDLGKKNLSMFGKVNYLSQLLEFQTKIDLDDLSHLIFEGRNLSKEDEAFKGILTYRDKEITLESLTGKLFGCDFTFLPQSSSCSSHESIFTASVRINFTGLLPLLDKETQNKIKDLKITDGFLLQGNLILNKESIVDSYFRGFFSGKNYEACGFSFKNLHSLVTYDDKKLIIEDFTLADSALILKMQKGSIDLSSSHLFDFEIDQFNIQDLRPSLLKKPLVNRGKIKPFLIRHLFCEKITGNLLTLDTIQGAGQLKFINTFKRENHLMDIPIEIISRLGLDMGLLVPVRGEIDFEIKNQKIVLKELKNSFSDGKRSHFYFPSNKSCFIDFDGNLQIDVRMKQYVLFKITQPFTLSLRGNLSHPSFSLK